MEKQFTSGGLRMIRRKGNSLVLTSDIFDQLEVKYHFPFDVLKKNPVGYIYLDIIWLLYIEEKALIRVPFARNRLWYLILGLRYCLNCHKYM